MNARGLTGAALVVAGTIGIIAAVAIITIRRRRIRPVNDREARWSDRLAAIAIGVALLVSVLLESIGVALIALPQ